ncbi:hypothetical protein F4818DRAFT_443465 [Hypoxylon cercidicola]|nr:hypothetical protein F4818DRAFT_443465 [Hypoxylon cercidicola]
MATKNLETVFWVRIKRRKTRLLDALRTEDFTYLNLPGAISAHCSDPKLFCREAGLPVSVIDKLRDFCIETCNASQEVLGSARREAAEVVGEPDRDVLVQKWGVIRNRAKVLATGRIQELYEFAEKTVTRFPGPDLPEQAADLFIHAAYWIEYAFRALVSGLRYISSKVDLLMAGDPKPLDGARDICKLEVSAAIDEIKALFRASPDDFVIV